MDLLFSKYASPFLLLDGYLTTGRFREFVLEFFEIEAEKKSWEFYLAKIEDKSYNEFKADMEPTQQLDPVDFETTIADSKNILNGFNPQ